MRKQFSPESLLIRHEKCVNIREQYLFQHKYKELKLNKNNTKKGGSNGLLLHALTVCDNSST